MTVPRSLFAGAGSPRLALRVLAVSLLAGAALAVGASAVGAQTTPPEPPVTLVTNLGQYTDSALSEVLIDTGQAFTTGRHHRGYVVNSVTVRLRYGPDPLVSGDPFVSGDFELGIWSSDANGRPVEKLGVLTVPDSLLSKSTELRTYDHVFTAPASGIYLKPETTYFVVLDVLRASLAGKIHYTSTFAEDPSGQMYWSIADGHVYGGRVGSEGWTKEPAYAFQIGVAGELSSRWELAAAEAGLPLSDADHIHQQGQNAWRDPAARCRSRPPYMSNEDVMKGYVWHCNARTGEYVKGFFRD